MRGTKALVGRLVLATGLFTPILALAPAGRAADGDLEARVKALEERIAKLEGVIAERDAEVARLRERLEDRAAPGWSEPRGKGRDEFMERWRDQLGQLDDEMRRELEQWGMEWGLPGRSFRNMPGPIELMPTRRALLGIEMKEGESGVEIASVIPGSPAEKAGLEPGDLIVEIDGREVATALEIAESVGSRRPGDAITVTVERDGDMLNLSATLAAPPGRRGGMRFPEFPLGPLGKRGQAGPGRSPQPAPRSGSARDSIDVDVPVPGGRSRVRLSAPGLFLSETLAKRLDLTERERRAVEDALSEAREDFVEKLVDQVRGSRGKADTAEVARLRLEAEAAARQLLVGKLPEAKLSALERAQAEAASESSVSVSVRASVGAGGAGGKEPEEWELDNPLERLFERAQEF